MNDDYKNPIHCAVHCRSCDRCFATPEAATAHRDKRDRCMIRPVTTKAHAFGVEVGKCDTYPKTKGETGFVSVWQSYPRTST